MRSLLFYVIFMEEEKPKAEGGEEGAQSYRQIDPQTGVVMSAGSREEAAENARLARENSN